MRPSPVYVGECTYFGIHFDPHGIDIPDFPEEAISETMEDSSPAIDWSFFIDTSNDDGEEEEEVGTIGDKKEVHTDVDFSSNKEPLSSSSFSLPPQSSSPREPLKFDIDFACYDSDSDIPILGGES
jgi:hypothetical protein